MLTRRRFIECVAASLAVLPFVREKRKAEPVVRLCCVSGCEGGDPLYFTMSRVNDSNDWNLEPSPPFAGVPQADLYAVLNKSFGASP